MILQVPDIRYESETEFRLVIKFSALFSILIAGLGLFGMLSYTSERRKKEIGIRLANGASAAGNFYTGSLDAQIRL